MSLSENLIKYQRQTNTLQSIRKAKKELDDIGYGFGTDEDTYWEIQELIGRLQDLEDKADSTLDETEIKIVGEYGKEWEE